MSPPHAIHARLVSPISIRQCLALLFFAVAGIQPDGRPGTAAGSDALISHALQPGVCVRLLSNVAAFRSSFSRFGSDSVNGLTNDKLARLGCLANITDTFGDYTATCEFWDGTTLDFPIESFESVQPCSRSTEYELAAHLQLVHTQTQAHTHKHGKPAKALPGTGPEIHLEAAWSDDLSEDMKSRPASGPHAFPCQDGVSSSWIMPGRPPLATFRSPDLPTHVCHTQKHAQHPPVCLSAYLQRKRARACAFEHKLACVHGCKHELARSCTRAQTHAGIHRHTRMHSHAQVHRHTCAHRCTHVLTLTDARTRAPTALKCGVKKISCDRRGDGCLGCWGPGLPAQGHWTSGRRGREGRG